MNECTYMYMLYVSIAILALLTYIAITINILIEKVVECLSRLDDINIQRKHK